MNIRLRNMVVRYLFLIKRHNEQTGENLEGTAEIRHDHNVIGYALQRTPRHPGG